MDDGALIAAQLGRAPRGAWRVRVRCGHGYPVVIATAPLLGDGTPFPTMFYLTCPHLVEMVSALESSGEIEAWRARLAGDASLTARLRAADAAYRAARAAEAGGADPIPEVGIAGQRDPLGIKCLHAHVASALVGIDDPVGHGTLAQFARECDNGRCAAFRTDSEPGVEHA